jgi:nitrite reductase/ring-hydroxylating ferredoxin subunit
MPVVANPGDLGAGQMTSVDLQGVRVGLANVEGAFYAFSDACSHDGLSLSAGRLDGTTLTCSCGSRFDLLSGNVLSGPALKRIRTFRVQVSGDELRI